MAMTTPSFPFGAFGRAQVHARQKLAPELDRGGHPHRHARVHAGTHGAVAVGSSPSRASSWMPLPIFRLILFLV